MCAPTGTTRRTWTATECPTRDVCADGDDTVDGDGDGVADACDACPLDALDDSDGDGVCDTDDVCDGHDDGVDGDGDGPPDGCDACPLDATDDTDGDGVCDGVDECPGHPDHVDNNNNGVPDGCDPADTPILAAVFDDYDVGSDGRIVTVDASAGTVTLSCYDATGAVGSQHKTDRGYPLNRSRLRG